MVRIIFLLFFDSPNINIFTIYCNLLIVHFSTRSSSWYQSFSANRGEYISFVVTTPTTKWERFQVHGLQQGGRFQ